MKYLLFQISLTLKIFVYVSYIMFEVRAHPLAKRETAYEHNRNISSATESHKRVRNIKMSVVRASKICTTHNVKGPVHTTTTASSTTPLLSLETDSITEYEIITTAVPMYESTINTDNSNSPGEEDQESSTTDNTDTSDYYYESTLSIATEDSGDYDQFTETDETDATETTTDISDNEITIEVPTYTDEEDESSNHLASPSYASESNEDETSDGGESVPTDNSEELSLGSAEILESTTEMSFITEEMEYVSTEPAFIEESVTEYDQEFSSKHPSGITLTTKKATTNAGNSTKTTPGTIPTVPIIGGGIPGG